MMRAARLLAAIASLAGCEPEVRRVIAETQLTLHVDVADPQLRVEADALRAQLYVREQAGWRAGSTGMVGRDALNFPVDLPVLPRGAEERGVEIEVLLELWGGGQRLAEERVVTRFVPGQVVTVPVTLARCPTPELTCDGTECHGAACAECDASGACTPVGYATTSVGSERDAAVPGSPEAGGRSSEVERREGGIDGAPMERERDASSSAGGSTIDAGPSSPDAGVRFALDAASSDGAAPATCPASHSCGSLHACALTTLGYTCRGQRADWPMPDGTAGAKFAPSFTAGAESVLDNVTKLEWQIGIPRVFPGCTGRTESTGGVLGDYGGLCTREEARRYCEQLTRAGKDDWRAPSLIELVSLFDMNDDTDWHRAIDGDYFGDTDHHVFVADTPAASGPTASWLVAYEYRAIFVERNVTGKVRCVRAGAEPPFATPSERYMVDAETVADRATQLSWQRAFSPTKLPPAEQSAYCAALGQGFRVPTPNELLTLVDPTRAEPAIDTMVFPGTPSAEFATSIASVVPNHVLFSTGELVRQEADAHVRCVR